MTCYSRVSIGLIFGLVFGIIYPYLWNYSTFKASLKIVTSTLANSIGGLTALYLFSPVMFDFVKPYGIGVVLLTLIGHTLGFHFYSKFENQKLAEELNQRLL